MSARKIAITIPERQAAAIERIRRRRKIPRSRVIQEAIALYLQREQHEKDVRRYVEGYLKHPEGNEAEVFAKLAAEVLEPEDWEE